MRASIYVLLALLSCSCAAVRVETCCDSVPRLSPGGTTVISDVDDTIKETHVKLGKTRISNPAMVLDGLRPWHPVVGMARLYQKWVKARTTIIYLSAEPCWYERRLRRSIQEWEFPSGAIVLRKGGLLPPSDYKTKAIDPIIKNSPGHHFVLIGDSGEFDPECYGELARKFPRQIDHIYIRNISQNDSDRYERAFRDIQKRKFDLFLRPDMIDTTRKVTQ